MKSSKIENVRSIALIQAKALGDFIVLLPAISALRNTYPQAEFVYLGKPWHAAFLQGRGIVDRSVVIPPIDGIRDEPEKKGRRNAPPTKEDPDELAAFFNTMNHEQFDLAIHFQGSGRTLNPFMNKLGARVTVGMRNKNAEAIDRSVPYVHYQSEVLRNMEIVSLVGATTDQLEPVFPLLESDIKEAEVALQGLTNVVVLHTGADDIRRLWPAEKFATIGNFLIEKGYTVVLTGTAQEEPIIKEVQHHMRQKAVSLCDTLSLGGLAGVLAKSKLVVSNDTGPLHLARAVGAKTVGIIWLPNLLNWGPLTRKNHRMAVGMTLACPQCGIIPADPWPFEPVTETCDHPYSFVKDVPVGQVLQHIQELLAL